MALANGTKIGRYEIRSKIGRVSDMPTPFRGIKPKRKK